VEILVVDHSRVFRTLWERMARLAGLAPIVVASGAEGLEFLRKRNVSVICVSLTLADMDGVDFCRQVRALPHGHDLPLILTTSTEQKAIRRRAFEAGATDVHPKQDIDFLFKEAARLAQEHDQICAGRVLYVEDSVTVATAMLKILGEMHLGVDHYKSATDAFEAFQSEDYDLVISDILVEGEMSGFGLVSRIRADAERHWIPILAISGMEDLSRRVELFRLGINDFVTKPVVEQEVKARVTNLITNKQLFDRVQEQQRHLYELAMTDQLTNLYNRNALAEFATKACAEANRHELHLSVVMLDIDHFKRINDDHGHQVGDEVLVAVSELMMGRCRKEDFAIRLGGEELLLVLTHCDRADAVRCAEQLREEIEALRPAGVEVTASLGVASRAQGQEIDLDGLLRAADSALYAAKNGGRNRVVEEPTHLNTSATSRAC
jgi:two-component system cell cycle response regulator